MALEDRRRVPRTTDGGVDHPTGRHRGEELDDLLQEHRRGAGTPQAVRRRRRSPAAPRRAGARRDVSPERTRWEAGGEGAFHRAARGTAGERRRSSHLGCRLAPLGSSGGWCGPSVPQVRAGGSKASLATTAADRSASSASDSAGPAVASQISARLQAAVDDDLAPEAGVLAEHVAGMTTRPCWSGVISAAWPTNWRSAPLVGLPLGDGVLEAVGLAVEALDASTVRGSRRAWRPRRSHRAGRGSWRAAPSGPCRRARARGSRRTGPLLCHGSAASVFRWGGCSTVCQRRPETPSCVPLRATVCRWPTTVNHIPCRYHADPWARATTATHPTQGGRDGPTGARPRHT